MSFCNPDNIEDFYLTKPESTKETPDNPDPGVPAKDGNLLDPDTPGNIISDSLAEAAQNYAAAVAGAFDPARLADLATMNMRIQAAAAFAATVNTLDSSIEAMEGVVARTNALRSFSQHLDTIRAGNLTGLANNMSEGLAALKDLRQAILGFDSWTPENKKAWDSFEQNYITPTINWSRRVDSLVSRGAFNYQDNGDGTFSIPVDLSDSDGSLTDLVEVLAGTTDALGAIPVPWLAGTGQTVSTWLRGGLSIWQGVLEAERGIDDVLKAAEDFMAAGATVLVAACEAVPALHMMLKQALDSVWAFGKFLSGLQLKLPAINLHFKLPNLPTFDRLAKWAGVASNLNEGLKAALSKCAESWTASFDNDGSTMPNMNALSDGLNGLKNARQAIENGKAGIGRTTAGTSKSTEAAKKAWDQTQTILGIAPAVPHTLPSELAELGAVAGETAKSGVDPDAVPDGRSDVDISALHGKDGSGAPTLPNPHQQIENRTKISSELGGMLHLSRELGGVCVEVGTAARKLGPNATLDDALVALRASINAAQVTMACGNLGMDVTLLAGLSPALRDYLLCLAAKREAGEIVPETDQNAMNAAAAAAFTPPGGMANSVASIANTHSDDPSNPSTTADLIANPLDVGAPTTWFSQEQRNFVGTFQDPLAEFQDPNELTTNELISASNPFSGMSGAIGAVGSNLEDLPLMILSRTVADRNLLNQIKVLNNVLEGIRSDETLRRSHEAVLIKAVQQGIAAGSPYTWLAEGLSILDGYVKADGTQLTLLEVVGMFLAHKDNHDIRPLVYWLAAIRDIDDQTPFPNDLTSDSAVPYNETFAANQSYSFFRRHGQQPFSETILGLRANADILGRQLSYEYVLALAALVITNRMKAHTAIPASDPNEIVRLAKVAKGFTSQMTNGDQISGVIDALAGL